MLTPAEDAGLLDIYRRKLVPTAAGPATGFTKTLDCPATPVPAGS